jgi:hypothetical protein
MLMGGELANELTFSLRDKSMLTEDLSACPFPFPGTWFAWSLETFDFF